MPNYECSLCNYNTNIRTHFTKHLTTKKHQNNLIKLNQKHGDEKQTLIFPSKTLNCEFSNPQKPSIFTQKPSIDPQFYSISHNKFSCKHCGRSYSRKDNLKRHLDNGCKEKNNEIADLKEKIDILLNKEAVSSNTNTNSNNTNSHNTTNSNNVQNNTINLNVFGKEDLSMLTDDFKQELIKGPFKMMPKLMEMIYFNKEYPENHTIKMVNKNKELMKIHDEEGWKLADKEETVDYILEDKNYEVDSYYDDNEEEFSMFVKKTYKKFRKLFDSRDRKLWKKLKRDVDILIWNNM